MLKEDAEQLKKELSFACSVADKTASKIKKMDLVTKRVEDCLTRVGDVADLKTCTEGIQSALDNEEYENAALIVQRFLKIDEAEVKKSSSFIESSDDGMTSMEEAFSKLHAAKRKLQEMVLTKFDESVKEDDVAMVERFFKLFPFLNQEKVGLRKFSNYLSTKIHDDLGSFMSSSSTTSSTNSSTPSHPEQLGNLFQVIAKIIDVHQPLVETYYKHGNLLYVMDILQKECDRRAKKILDDFKSKRNFKTTVRFIQKSLKNTSSWSSSSANTVRLDPRDLDTLLTEMIFITSRSETYLKFLRKRAMDDFEVAYPDSSSPERTDAMNRLESFIRSCELSCLIQELSGYYVLMEEYFLRESITKAIEMDEESEMSSESVTSNLLDDVFFILKKCVRRATSSGNMDVLCAIINHSITVLETTYADALNERIRYGFPNTLASAAANLDLSQAYNVLQSGRYLQSSSDLEKTKKLFLTGINNLDASSQCISTLRQNIREEVSRSTVLAFANGSDSLGKKQSGKLDSCLLDMSPLTSKFQSLLHTGIHQMYLSLLKPRIKSWVEGLTDAENELLEEDIHSIDSTTEAGLRQFTSSFLFDVDQVLKTLQPRLTPSNYNSLIGVFAGECASRMETAIFKCSFNRLGAFQLDRELRAIINYLTSCTSSTSVRDKFSRLRQVVTLLNVETVGEAADYTTPSTPSSSSHTHGLSSSSSPTSWRLSPTDVRSILKLRVDFDRSDIRRLKL